MEAIELNTSHYHDAMDLWMAAPAISGTEKSDQLILAFKQSLGIYLTHQTPSRLIGAFKNRQLSAILSMDKLYGWPYYAVGFLAVRKSNFFNPVKNGISACYAFMEKKGEDGGWYRYYTHQAANKWKDWRYTFDPQERYEVTIEEYVPANGIPTNEAFWPLMSYQTWEVPTTIKSISLRKEFRPLPR